MKGFVKLLDIIFTAFTLLWDLVEFLAGPALFVVIGLLNSFSWQYYAISIGGYLLLFITVEIVAHFVFKALDKKYTPFFERKLEKFFDRLSGKKSEE